MARTTRKVNPRFNNGWSAEFLMRMERGQLPGSGIRDLCGYKEFIEGGERAKIKKMTRRLARRTHKHYIRNTMLLGEEANI